MRKNVVVQRMKEDTRGEDLRVLYVALTRAKEKLILTGYVNDFDKKLANNVHLTMESAAKLPCIHNVIFRPVQFLALHQNTQMLWKVLPPKRSIFDTDNKRLYAILKSEQEQWIAEGTVTAEELACVGINRIKNFFQSNLAKRMIAANARNRLFKEQPFVLGIGADQLKPGFPSTEIVLIQGVIDVRYQNASYQSRKHT